MKIALVNAIKPVRGSGIGFVEYTLNMYECLKRNNDVDVFYALDSAKQNDTLGLVYANTLFRVKVMKIISGGYDIVHITDHELGFVAKMLHGKTKAKIVTTVHDLIRFDKRLHKGFLQNSYDALVKRNLESALKFSDMVLFNSSQTMEDVKNMFGLPRKYRVINHGTKESVLRAPSKRRRHDKFTVGYIGALAYHKNVIFMLKTAEILKKSGAYKFLVYGAGAERTALAEYKKSHELKNVELMGFAQESRIPEIYDSFDAFVFPSLSEGFGHPILEAQARGLPVLVYKHGRIPEEVRRYCLKVNDAEQAASTLRNLKEHGYDNARKNRATAYARSFTWRRTAEASMSVYRELLKV